ncbi:MAG: helix-turn-helix domain-containing protein [Lachnospiraceae bacterium]|nr:helix-turn-helix domain-containing protein [Lachnospiraceae bacterium]
MPRDYGKEIDELKDQISALQEMIKTALEERMQTENEKVGHVEKMKNMFPNAHINACLDEMENIVGKSGQTGGITYFGVFSSGGRQSTWVKNCINTDDLLKLIANNVAEKVLSCLGNADRLNILLALLRKPMSVVELVTECKLNSTGQAYHHMKPLLAADLITEDGKGIYVVQPYKVQGIIMLLAGICDMADETYSKSRWDSEE